MIAEVVLSIKSKKINPRQLESAIQKENVNTELVCARACLQELEDENSSLQDDMHCKYMSGPVGQ